MTTIYEAMILNSRLEEEYEDMVAWAANNFEDGVFQDLPGDQLDSGIHYDNARAFICGSEEDFNAVYAAYKEDIGK